jgi:hypothetical protein
MISRDGNAPKGIRQKDGTKWKEERNEENYMKAGRTKG